MSSAQRGVAPHKWTPEAPVRGGVRGDAYTCVWNPASSCHRGRRSRWASAGACGRPGCCWFCGEAVAIPAASWNAAAARSELFVSAPTAAACSTGPNTTAATDCGASAAACASPDRAQARLTWTWWLPVARSNTGVPCSSPALAHADGRPRRGSDRSRKEAEVFGRASGLRVAQLGRAATSSAHDPRARPPSKSASSAQGSRFQRRPLPAAPFSAAVNAASAARFADVSRPLQPSEWHVRV